MRRTGLIFGTALTVVCALSAPPAQAAAPLTTKGPGFKISTQLGVTSVSPTRPYTVTFASADLKRRYTPYLATALSQLRAAGVRISFGGVETVRRGTCPPAGHIHYVETYRPLGRGGFSKGMPCADPPGGVALSGVVAMDSEYFDGSWYISRHKLSNTFVHEMLHTLGLDHPNLDLDEDGVVETYECVTDEGGLKPVMCSPNGGYRTSGAAELTGLDLDGIKALLANARAGGGG